MELDFSGLAHGSYIVTPLPSLKQAVLSSEKTPGHRNVSSTPQPPASLQGHSGPTGAAQAGYK